MSGGGVSYVFSHAVFSALKIVLSFGSCACNNNYCLKRASLSLALALFVSLERQIRTSKENFSTRETIL